ncbi:hypothetical protein [Nocardia terpenica]|uniref:ESX-1 secretion-associated protein n=1 Tax=Nocardia terpenica TaxID=455432 RepID=A0A291RRZ5_9NOCA|nr:hypothetical protein [Nocardia terpenica]ATL70253.1 hypothetical protein CRH09_32785 [Nocardia terpenica]
MSELDVWKQLAAEVSQGNLKLKVHRDALDQAVKHLQGYIDHLDTLSFALETVATVSGFGGFQIGVQLAQKFTDKGSGNESIKQRLKELQDEAKAIQDTLHKAAVAYAESDRQFADVLKNGTSA